MKNKLLITVFLIGWLTSSSSYSQNLYVGLKSGSIDNYPLGSVDKLSFSISDLIVSLKTGAPVSYGLSSVRKLYFNETVSVAEPALLTAKPLRIYPNPARQSVTIENLPAAPGTVSIYRMDGQLVQTVTVDSSTLVLDISGLSDGLYLLFINGRTAKFLKQ
jgi:hypothetical protein